MQTIAWEDEEWPNEAYCDFLKRALDYQENPQAAKKRKSAFQMLKWAGDRLPSSTVLQDVITWQDLQLFAGKSSEEPYLGSIVNRTHTELGFVYLLHMLANPSCNRDEIVKRQSIVKALVADKELLLSLTQLLEAIKKNEPYVLSFFLNDPLYNSADKQHYLNSPFQSFNEKVNKSASLLELYSLLGHKGRLTHAGFTALSTIVLPSYVITQLAQITMPEKFEQFSLRLSGAAGADNALLTLLDNKSMTLGAMIAAAYYCFASTKKECVWARDNFLLDWCLQKKLHGVQTYFESCKSISQLITSGNIAHNLSFYKNIKDRLNPALGSEQARSLKSLLSTSTFIQEPSYASHHGRILCAYKNMHECKQEFLPLFLAIAQLDAYCAIATLYNEYLDKPVNFCFAEIVDAPRPVVIVDSFWNPFINHDHVVPSSLSINPTDAHTILLTGPNAGGKSTIVKGIALTLVLAQSFGIAPAKYAVITPFDQIVTYLNITDDISKGNSLFKSQVVRMQYIVDRATALSQQNKKIFVAIDEMFNGTSPKEAMACAYSVAKHLGSFENTINIIATHYHELTKLPKFSNMFENYKVSVAFIAEGHITYPYTLQKGISDQHVAIDILKEEGLSGNIIDQAKKLMISETN